MDRNIERLVNALNAFDGIVTIGSCGGHDHPGPGQWESGSWYVIFEVAPTEHGRFALEFLAWLINRDYRRSGHDVIIYPDAPPPYLSGKLGACLRYNLEGQNGESADRLADWIETQQDLRYISPEEARE